MPRVSPELTAVAVVAICLAPVAALVEAWRRKDAPPRAGGFLRRRIGAVLDFISARPIFFLGWSVSLVTFAIQIFIPYNPRYQAIITPFVFLLAARTTMVFVGRRSTIVLTAALCLFHLLNADGRFSLSVEPILKDFPYAHTMNERDRRIVHELKSNVDGARYVAEHCADEYIVTEPPFGQYLGLPQLGVVKKPLRGCCYGVYSDFIKDFRHGEIDDGLRVSPKGVVVIGREIPKHHPPKPEDVLWKDDRRPPLIVYRVGPKKFPADPPAPALRWALEDAAPNLATLEQNASAATLRLNIAKTTAAQKEVVVKEADRRFTYAKEWVIRFRARSNQERAFTAGIVGLPDPRFGRRWEGRIDQSWTNFQYDFVSNDAEGAGRLELRFGPAPGWVEIERIEIQSPSTPPTGAESRAGAGGGR
jgi:hypothetical protein